MITLSEAFKLCDVGKESVYLRRTEDTHGVLPKTYHFWSEQIRQKLDMEKICVTKIDSAFRGWIFVVTGISDDDLQKAELAD